MMKKDSIVYVSILGIHHNPQYFPNPLQFQPERFAKQNYEDALYYLPFGIGPRKCYGQKLAIMIMKCTLAMLVSKYTIQTIPGETIDEVDFELLNFVSQSHEIKVKITERSIPVPEPIKVNQNVEISTANDIPVRKMQNISIDTSSTSSCAVNISSTSGSQSVDAEMATSQTIASEATSTVNVTDELKISGSESNVSSSFPLTFSTSSPQPKLRPKKAISLEQIPTAKNFKSARTVKPKPLQLDIHAVPVSYSKGTKSTADIQSAALLLPSSFHTFNPFIPRSPTKSAKSTPTKAKVTPTEEVKDEDSPTESPTVFHFEVEVHDSLT